MDGGNSLIKDVLYIPIIKCNILSIFQLLDKDYKIHMETKMLHIMDENLVFILKATMVTNRTFKFELKAMDLRCLAIATSRKEWLWNYRVDHLNFRYLNTLQRNKRVTRLSLINILAKIYKERVQAK